MFGLSAAAIAGIATTAIAAGSAIYSANQQKKALAAQRNTVQTAVADDKKETARAEAEAATAANQAIADARRRRRTSALSLGAPAAADTLGSSSVLGTATKPAATALSGGS